MPWNAAWKRRRRWRGPPRPKVGQLVFSAGRVGMNVFWLQQTESDVSPGTDWLCDSELLSLRGLSVPKRRADWRLGRWTAKCAVAAYFGHSMEFCVLRDIEISHNASGAPEVSLAGNSPGIEISLSHRSGTAVCAIAPTGTLLGCDLEVVEPHSEAFVRDYFSAEEQAFVMDLPSAYRPGFLALLWSAKESALKALQQGLRRDTRSVVLAFLNGSSILA